MSLAISPSQAPRAAAALCSSSPLLIFYQVSSHPPKGFLITHPVCSAFTLLLGLKKFIFLSIFEAQKNTYGSPEQHPTAQALSPVTLMRHQYPQFLTLIHKNLTSSPSKWRATKRKKKPQNSTYKRKKFFLKSRSHRIIILPLGACDTQGEWRATRSYSTVTAGLCPPLPLSMPTALFSLAVT